MELQLQGVPHHDDVEPRSRTAKRVPIKLTEQAGGHHLPSSLSCCCLFNCSCSCS